METTGDTTTEKGKPKIGDRIRWGEDEENARSSRGVERRRSRSRSRSADSLAIQRARSRSRSRSRANPSHVLPTTYRTV